MKTSEQTNPDTIEQTSPDTTEQTSPDTTEQTSPYITEKTSPDTTEQTSPDTTEQTTGKINYQPINDVTDFKTSSPKSLNISTEFSSETELMTRISIDLNSNENSTKTERHFNDEKEEPINRIYILYYISAIYLTAFSITFLIHLFITWGKYN